MSEQNTAPLGAGEHARMWDLLAQHEELPEGEHHPQETQAELHSLLSRSGSLIAPGRIPLNAAEHAAVDKLAAKHPDAPLGLTRRDPGNTGPLLVHAVDAAYLVSEQGKATKQKAAS